MKIFIEAERESSIRYRYNEKTYKLEKTDELIRAYPYAYGFIIGSNTNLLDSLDSFIISNRKIEHNTIQECEPIDVFILKEDNEIDIKIISKLIDEEIVWSNSIKDEIDEFLNEIFKKFPDIRIEIGEMLGRNKAYKYINDRYTNNKSK